MSKKKSKAAVIKSENKATDRNAILKAEAFQAYEDDPFRSAYSENDLIEPPYPIYELDRMVEYSTILQQCIEAYKRNIVGYGVLYKYHEDLMKQDETPEMKAEYDRLQEWVKYFNFDMSFEDVWGLAIEHRERTGNGYIEIIRDGAGLPVGGENVDPCGMRLTLMSKTDVVYNINGKEFKRRKGFRKYVQRIGGKKIWFKEFGDPRFMNLQTGEFTTGHNGDNEASEILHLKIGDKAYGIPRWIGQIIHMYGARKAEELNYNYFENGRHTPAAVVVSNGMLTDESLAKLQDYADDVKGTDNAHKFLILEAEGLDDGVLPGEDRQGVKVELKSLADILQQDALFLEYDEASRKKVQSAFRLPDIYVGRSTDFNRATAETAKQITEEQVFEPERNSIEWMINNILLLPQNFQSAVLAFKPQEISDVDDKVKLLTILNTIGSVTPNDTRDEVGKLLGKELEPFDMPEADLSAPLRGVVQQKANMEQQALLAQQKTAPTNGAPNNPGQNTPPKKTDKNTATATSNKTGKNEPGKNQPPVKKELEDTTEAFIAIMKDVRDVLEEMHDGQGDNE